MLGHIKHLVFVGSSLLELGVALLVAAPQQPHHANQACSGSAQQPRQRLVLAQRRPVTFDPPCDPNLDLYELAECSAFKIYVQ